MKYFHPGLFVKWNASILRNPVFSKVISSFQNPGSLPAALGSLCGVTSNPSIGPVVYVPVFFPDFGDQCRQVRWRDPHLLALQVLLAHDSSPYTRSMPAPTTCQRPTRGKLFLKLSHPSSYVRVSFKPMFHFLFLLLKGPLKGMISSF